MVGDHEAASRRASVNSPASGLRLSVPRRGRRVDAAGAERQLSAPALPRSARSRGRGPARPVDERHAAIGAEQEADADVAARLAAVLIGHRVDLAVLVGRPARRRIASMKRVQRERRVATPWSVGAVVVLDLLSGQDVGRSRLSTTIVGQPVELRLRVVGGEVLDVDTRRSPARWSSGDCVISGLIAAVGARRRSGHVVLEVAERVVARPR